MRRRHSPTGLLVALVLAVSCGAAAASSTEALVDYLNGLSSFAATFEQTRYDEDGELLERAQGECQIKRPGRFRWIYSEPYQQSIVSDGAHLWVYDEDLDQVTENEVGATAQGSPAALLGRETDVVAHYAITPLEARDDGFDWYELTPRTESPDFTAIELGFGDGEIRAMRLRDNLGQMTDILFGNVTRNGSIGDERFAFEIPPGVDVIHGAAP